MFKIEKRAREKSSGELYRLHHTDPQRGTITVWRLSDSADSKENDFTVERNAEDFEIIDLIKMRGEE